jgi:uncharacterized protein YutE (UPF0331/DUF86 family)
VERHLLALRAAVENLGRHRDVGPATLRTNADLRWVVERGLQVCSQNALDVATHLAAAAGLDAPDYASAIDRLAEMEILPAEFAYEFRAIAGLRNVLVHGYLEVDLAILTRIVRERLADFSTFADHVQRHLQRS